MKVALAPDVNAKSIGIIQHAMEGQAWPLLLLINL